MTFEEIKAISKEILEKEPINALQYSVTEGYNPLREAVKGYLNKKYGLVKEDEDLIITSGAQQAIALSARVLCNKGDLLASEDPSFIGSLNAFRSYGIGLVGIKTDADGVNLASLEEAFKNENVKVFYTIPNFQNPSGITMSLDKRKAVLALAEKYNKVIRYMHMLFFNQWYMY